MSCIIQDGRCHTAPELDFFGDLIFPFSISRRCMGSTISRVLASPSRELLPTYLTVHSSTVYWTGTLMVVEDDGTANCGIWYAGIMSFISALSLVKGSGDCASIPPSVAEFRGEISCLLSGLLRLGTGWSLAVGWDVVHNRIISYSQDWFLGRLLLIGRKLMQCAAQLYILTSFTSNHYL